jgi:tetratricopeptide (TPR) repeat protein
MESLFTIFGNAFGNVWLHSRSTTREAISTAFGAAFGCRHQREIEQGQFLSVYLSDQCGRGGVSATPEQILSFAMEFGYMDSEAEYIARVGMAMEFEALYEEAIKYYRRASIDELNVARCYIRLGNLREDNNMYQDAAKYYEEAIRSDPQNETAAIRFLWQVKVKIARDEDPESLIGVYKTAITRDPENLFQYLNDLGETYIHKKDFRSAVDVYLEAASLDPKSFRGKLGRAYDLSGDWKRAAEEYLNGIRATSDETWERGSHRQQWAEMGRKQQICGESQVSKIILEDAMAKDPEGFEYYLEPLGNAQSQIGDWAGAIRSYKRLLKHKPTMRLWRSCGIALMEAGRFKDAEACFQNSIKLASSSQWIDEIATSRLLGDVYIATDRNEDAKQLFQVKLSDPLVRRRISNRFTYPISRSAGDACLSYLGTNSTSGKVVCGEMMLYLAWLYEQERDLDNSSRLYQQSADLFLKVCVASIKYSQPHFADQAIAHFSRYLGLIYEKLGNNNLALTWLEIAAWQYEHTLGSDHEWTTEIKVDIKRVSGKIESPEGLLAWAERERRERLSYFHNFISVKVDEAMSMKVAYSP